MSNTLRICSLLFILSPFTIVFLAQAETKVISFNICYENIPQPPYYYGTGETIPLEKPGIYIEISKFLMENLELSVTHVRAPWKRCLSLLQKNTVDAVYGASFDESRLLYGRYPMKKGILDEERRLTTKSYSLYKNREATINWDGETLTNANTAIAAPLGYSIVPFLRERGAEVETRWTTELGLSLVSMGRISSFAAQDPAADALLKDDPSRYSNVVKIIPALQEKPYYMIISHKFYEQEPEISEAIWDNVARFRKNNFPDLMIHY